MCSCQSASHTQCQKTMLRIKYGTRHRHYAGQESAFTVDYTKEFPQISQVPLFIAYDTHADIQEFYNECTKRKLGLQGYRCRRWRSFRLIGYHELDFASGAARSLEITAYDASFRVLESVLQYLSHIRLGQKWAPIRRDIVFWLILSTTLRWQLIWSPPFYLTQFDPTSMQCHLLVGQLSALLVRVREQRWQFTRLGQTTLLMFRYLASDAVKIFL